MVVRVEIEMRVRDGKESVKKVWVAGGSRGIRGRMGWSLGNGWPRRQRQEGEEAGQGDLSVFHKVRANASLSCPLRLPPFYPKLRHLLNPPPPLNPPGPCPSNIPPKDHKVTCYMLHWAKMQSVRLHPWRSSPPLGTGTGRSRLSVTLLR